MPVTARRTALLRAVTTSESSTRPTGRTLAKHRKTSKSPAPRAAAAVLSVGLAMSGGAALSVVTPAETAHAGTSKTTSAAWARGNKPIATKPLLRYADAGSAVRYVQKSLDVPAGGWYGSATRTAVANFQRRVGLPRTGTMTVNTWRSLFYAASHGLLHGGSSKSSSFHARVLKEAAKLKGTPYRYGGTTPKGFDCSGYTGYVYKKAGKKLPRTSRAQYSATKRLSRKAAKPGDLVFFKSGGGSVYHVGIYAGGNMLWHSSKPGRPIGKAKIWSSNVAFGRK
ncbi:NLP/P60 protein [Kribbella flavida DSM 17836]|uniref:NLP/P60 protein n=1 Tax=Kribbella flavida (strain DSM 17836 / JCM 10339 / NBRC 14399) TaxID=479435 RepID=D2PXA4_KRIFD|nr:C40 family peptidase [Kribbella flavida]ADB29752.1 NLP/P60 protein [Kribbella flavida DSM 17836]